LPARAEGAYNIVMPSPRPTPSPAGSVVRGRSFPADRAGESASQDFVRGTLEELGVPPHALRAALVALDEAVSNVVKYAGATRFGIAVAASAQGIRVSLSDNGRPFDPTGAPTPDVTRQLETRPIGGLGIHIIRALARDLSYCRVGEKNRFRFLLAR